MRISDWSSDVCSSDLQESRDVGRGEAGRNLIVGGRHAQRADRGRPVPSQPPKLSRQLDGGRLAVGARDGRHRRWKWRIIDRKSVGEGKSGSVRVDLGGRRIVKKKTQGK